MQRSHSKKSQHPTQPDSAMVPTFGQNRSRRDNKQIEAGNMLRALQDQLERLTKLPIQTPEDAQAAAAKGKAFVTQLNNVKKALHELQPQQKETLPRVCYRNSKQGDMASAKREQEQAQQFYEEAKSKLNALVQQYHSWDKQVKEARKEGGRGGGGGGGGENSSSWTSDTNKKSSVLMKSVSKSVCPVTNSSIDDDDGSSRLMLVKPESKETVKMADGGSGGGKTSGFGGEDNCDVEEIGEQQLSGRSSIVDLREIEQDQRLALEDDVEKMLIIGGRGSSRFKNFRDMESDEDCASSAIVLVNECRDMIDCGEQNENVMGLEGTDGTFESSVREEGVEFPRQAEMVESFGSNDHEHGEDNSKEECDSNMTKSSRIEIPIRPPDQVSKGKHKVLDSHGGSRQSTFEKKPSVLEQRSESTGFNDEKNGQSDDDDDDDDDGVSSNRVEAEVGVNVGSPEEKLKGDPSIPRQRSLDIDSKLSKWRNEVQFGNDESPLPCCKSSYLAKSKEEELESLKECWKLREENMKVPLKMQGLEDLNRSFLDERSRQKLHDFHAQTMPKFENQIEELSALDDAEENIMEVAAGVKPLDAMNEIVMMEDLLSDIKIWENPLSSSFELKIMDPEGNKFSELQQEIERVPTFKKFTDVHLLEEEQGEEEGVKPAIKAIRRPQSGITLDEEVYNGRDKSQLNLHSKEELLRMNLVQSQKLAHPTIIEDPVAENLYAKDKAESATQCSEELTVKSSTKSCTRNVSGPVFNIQNSTNCFFPDSAPISPVPPPPPPPPPPPGIDIVKQSPIFKALEKKVIKVEEEQLKQERELEKKTMEKMVRSEIKNREKAQKKEKHQLFRTLVLSVMAIFAAGLAYAIYKVEKSPPPT